MPSARGRRREKKVWPIYSGTSNQKRVSRFLFDCLFIWGLNGFFFFFLGFLAHGLDGSRNCTTSSFRCPDNGNCIPQQWVCDGDPDCDGGADEKDCAALLARTCPPTQHRCGNGACLPADWRCDGDPDCSDMSDEMACGPSSGDDKADRDCGPDEFQCASGHCIKAAYRCDAEIHCPDVSDELDCGSSLPRCVEGDFRCPDGQCIAEAWRYDFLSRSVPPPLPIDIQRRWSQKALHLARSSVCMSCIGWTI